MDQNTHAIRLSGVAKSYPGVEAVQDASFVVHRGSIHAFLGPNGAGKSTTMRMIAGLIPPTSGKLEIEGEVGFLPENPPLYSNMTVQDYLKFVQKIRSLKKRSQSEFKLEELMAKTGLTHVRHRLIGNLSKGYRQRVGIAQALVANPPIVMLDEPTVGLDPKAIVEIRDLILSLKKDHTIFLSSHQLHEVEQICDEVTIINNGKIIATDTLETIRKKINKKQFIHLTCKRWNELGDKALQKFSFEIIRRYQKNDYQVVEIQGKTDNDYREDLIKSLLEADAGLVGFYELIPDLEEVFKSLTTEVKQ
jgi:ABC-2 type transport system ATP-binding protein